MSTISSFKNIENNHDVYVDKECMKTFCESLRVHRMEIINFKKEKMKPLTNKQQKSYQNAKTCYICQNKFEDEDKKYCKTRDYCHYTEKYRDATHSIYNLKYSVPKEISIVFLNGSYYDYHFIIKGLVEEFGKQFTCLRENTKKCITFSVPIQKELIKKEKKLQKPYPKDCNLLKTQELWQAHYIILLIILLQEFKNYI